MEDQNLPDNGETPPPSVFERINSICQTFVKETSAPGAKTANDRFLDYLKQVDGDDQPSLLRNILHNEIERRRREGRQPRPEDFLDALPGLERLVHQVFQELANMSQAVSTHKHPQDGPAQTVDYAPLSAKFLGDFQVVRELGRGGMGVVYEARHLSRGDRVALKTLRTQPELAEDTLENVGRLRRFKNEFRALADINHRHLVGLHTLEEDGGQYFFTMDLIDGENFLPYVRPDKKLDEPRLRSALAQLVTGVMALHRHNIVHRDLKPNNVMVDHDGQIKILDFGLVVDLAQNVGATTTIHFHGTPAYAAPEQANGQQTFASDWYAVGVMLHEALVGKRPFRGRSPMQLLKEKQERDPDSIVGQPNVPQDLAQLCMRLLSRQPGQRPQAMEIAQIVSAEATITKPVVETEHPLIGREEQLAALQDAYRFLLDQQQPLTVFISGLSGEGKSFLVQHFLAPLQKDKSLTILSGRCYDRESVPFKALDRLIDALSSYLEWLPETKAALMMPNDISFLSHLFPMMKRVGVVAQASTVRVSNLDEQQVRQRAHAALRELLSRISRQSPLIMFIDDLQWGDADSAKVMFHLLRPPEAPAVLFIGSFRSDKAAKSPFLNTWNDLQRKNNTQLQNRLLQVGPLTAEECVQLVESELAGDAELFRGRAQELYQEAGGNPFFLMELMDSFDRTSGELRRTPLHEVIDRKLTNLPKGAKRLLDVIAVSGQALSLREASQAAGHGDSAISIITHMRTEKLVRLIGSDDNPMVDTYHDKIRETAVGDMDGEARAATHLVLAETIEANAGEELQQWAARLESETQLKDNDQDEHALPRVYDLAYHFDAASKKHQAWKYSLLAAEQARRQYALETSVKQYEIVTRNADPSNTALRYRIAMGWAEVLMLIGRYEEAEQKLDGLIELVNEPESQARIEVLQSEIALKQARIKASIKYCEQGLRRLGVGIPKTFLGFGVGLLGQASVQVFHTLFPKRLHSKSLDSRNALINQFFDRISGPYSFSNMLKLLWSLQTAMNRAERFPPSPQLAFNYSFHAGSITMIGWFSRSRKYGQRSIEMRRKFNDAWGLGHSFSWMGIGLYAAARYEESIKNLTKAVEAFDKTGDLWELNLARFHLGSCCYRLGDLQEAQGNAQRVFESSIAINDSRSHCSLFLWSRATQGNLAFEDLECRFRLSSDDNMSMCNFLIGKGRWLLAQGRTEEAIETLEQSWKRAMKNIMVNFHTVAALTWLVTALRTRAEEVESSDPRQSKQLGRRAYRLAKRAAWVTRLFPGDYPHALRELGLLYAAKGRAKKALKVLEKSCAKAEKLGAKYEYAQSQFERAKLAQQLGLAEAEEQLRKAKAELDKFDEMIRSANAETNASQES